jgi:hypothetical protein
MREVNKRGPDYTEAKNILLYYRFGSSKKKKRLNYLMQLGDKLIMELYWW